MTIYSLVGAMKSCKTTHLNEIANSHSVECVDLEIQNNDIDIDFANIRNAIKKQYHSTTKIFPEKKTVFRLCKTPFVLIDEFQFLQNKKGYSLNNVIDFFEDINLLYNEKNITLVISSLYKDFKGEIFELTKWLYDFLKEKVHYLYAICDKCGTKKATLNPRKKGQGNALFVEDKDIYTTLCIDCFEKYRGEFEEHL